MPKDNIKFIMGKVGTVLTSLFWTVLMALVFTSFLLQVHNYFFQDYSVEFIARDHAWIKFMVEGKMEVEHHPSCWCLHNDAGLGSTRSSGNHGE